MVRLAGGLLIVVLILALLLGAAALYLRTSLPRTRGTLSLAGLGASVEIVRDRNAVPHIRAASQEDAYFALGVVHVQDRLWQMEFQRRVGAGRLAEVLGEEALPADRFVRTLGFYRAAEASLEALSPRARGLLDAYTAGINATLEARRGPLPPEFLLLRFRPEPWQAADVLVWTKMMAWDLAGNWDTELLRARLSGRLDAAQVEQLWPPYPGDAPTTVADATPSDAVTAALLRDLPLDALWEAAVLKPTPGNGSNAWAVAGARSATGGALLANDPHLGMQAPALWYLVRISAPGLDLTGATLPGVPAVTLGRNARISWGLTAAQFDTQDLFIERLDPSDPDAYLTPDGAEPFVTREETIRVRGEDDERLVVRETRHGPVISDLVDGAREVADRQQQPAVLTLAWPTLDDDDLSLQGYFALNTAGDWDEFRAAAHEVGSAPLNLIYADVDGNIGYQAAGRVPIRGRGRGLAPAPGWNGLFDWQGFIPAEELPQVFNPEGGVIVSANHKVVGDDYPHWLGSEWTAPYRAERIETLLDGLSLHGVESFARIQADQTSRMAAEFLPLLLSVEPDTSQARAAQALLLGWDGTMRREDAEPLIFAAWYREFSRLIYQDELGDLFDDYYAARPLFVRSVLSEHPAWCDDVRSSPIEGCDELAVRALRGALGGLNERYGADMTGWRWGDAHAASAAHRVMTNSPLRALFDLRIAAGGDGFTVDAAPFPFSEVPGGFDADHGPGYRAIYDLTEPDASRFIQQTGQSGNPLSLRYRDFLERWRDVRYLRIPTLAEEVELGKVGTLRLEPR